MQSQFVGTPNSHGPEAARNAASSLKGQSKAGADLAEERRKRIDDASRRRASTISRLLPDYLAALPLRPKLRGTGRLSAASVKNEADHLRLGLDAMAVDGRAIESVTVADLRRLLNRRAGQPATSRKHYGAVSRFFDWGVEEGMLTVNPASLLPKSRRPRPVAARAVCPAVKHLAAIWRAAEDLDEAERDFVHLLIAVPARLREVARMDWSHLNLDARTWSLPATSTKTRAAHLFHLPALALEILRRRHDAADAPTEGLVLPSPRAGLVLTTFTAIKRALSDTIAKKAAETAAEEGRSPAKPPAWTFHDFRRSFASACAEAGVAEAVADAILSHSQSATRGGVLGVYQRAVRAPEQIAAMAIWGRLLEAAIHGREEGGNVIPLHAGTDDQVAAA